MIDYRWSTSTGALSIPHPPPSIVIIIIIIITPNKLVDVPARPDHATSSLNVHRGGTSL